MVEITFTKNGVGVKTLEPPRFARDIDIVFDGSANNKVASIIWTDDDGKPMGNPLKAPEDCDDFHFWINGGHGTVTGGDWTDEGGNKHDVKPAPDSRDFHIVQSTEKPGLHPKVSKTVFSVLGGRILRMVNAVFARRPGHG
ncbi:MAG: hypothetical protein HYX92_22065 [Chloroflexi bacterium]|nr:hypothetical protein [Chloroflexota bacterium]